MKNIVQDTEKICRHSELILCGYALATAFKGLRSLVNNSARVWIAEFTEIYGEQWQLSENY